MVSCMYATDAQGIPSFSIPNSLRILLAKSRQSAQAGELDDLRDPRENTRSEIISTQRAYPEA